VGFLRQLVAWLMGHGIADPAQVYLAGMSNGGMMTLRMLCEAAELFAGAGTLANMPAGIGDGCRPKKPLPIVVLNGTADPLVPYGVFGRTDIFAAILGPGTRLISAPEVMLELFAGTGR